MDGQTQIRKSPAAPRRRGHILAQLAWAGQITLLLGALGMMAYVTATYFGAAAQRETRRVPSTMEEVDWHSPDSTEFCLACHRPVGAAMAGLDVAHGHPQNVVLSDEQVDAVRQMGAIIGPDNTLICLSCHKLGDEGIGRAMLAAPITSAELCSFCHPGHYARGTSHDLRISAPNERNRLGQTVAEGGPCSACHLAHRYAREFEPCAADPDGRCTTCHASQGCAAVRAREAMDHPESRCLECHNAHDADHGSFLKTNVVALCTHCHVGYSDGPAAGMHSIGRMDEQMPDVLFDRLATTADDPHELTCAVCHESHTADYEPLLPFPVDSNALCLLCHEEMDDAPTGKGVAPRHGQSPVLNASQRALVERWGMRVGPDGELLCVSCHDVHGAAADVALLAFAPQYGETCGACHPHHDGVFGTPHDLRTNHPDEMNLAGMTAAENGSCSACHLAHRFARTPAPTEGDASGQCATCHQAGQCAERLAVARTPHPRTQCTECHDPHTRRAEHFLLKSAGALCADCHEPLFALAGGPHDRSLDDGVWPDWTNHEGLCMPCHVAHTRTGDDLFRRHGEQVVSNHDDVCLSCHPDAAWGAATSIAAIHPHEISPEQQLVAAALVPTDMEGRPRIGCRTCHNPHAGAEVPHLARSPSNEPADRLCLGCHVEKKYIADTGHSSEMMRRAGFDGDSCRPCHAMHATPDGSWGQMLSPRFLRAACNVPEDRGPGCVPCLACHHDTGPAPIRETYEHAVAMYNNTTPKDPSYLPLYDESGHEAPDGRVVCRTCHLSHGRLDLVQRLAERGDLTPSERQSVSAHVRSFQEPNVCTSCHGPDARVLFLYFHDPGRRPKPTYRATDPGR